MARNPLVVTALTAWLLGICCHSVAFALNPLSVDHGFPNSMANGWLKLDDGWPESAEELVTLVLLEVVHKQ